MMRITADTLEEAYKKASSEFDTSIVDLDIEILQSPSKGLFGLFKKPAIIVAELKEDKKPHKKVKKIDKSENAKFKDEIFNSIKELMQSSCFDVECKSVEIKDDTVYIVLDGKDAALLIGKEGYRYKAISYMLHNWIKIKYDLNISLEIGEFLKNQESMIESYLVDVKSRVNTQGYAQTKPLDGILIKIALEKLRCEYPNKYVAIKSTKDGRKKVVVGDFRGESK
jgi:spoIIIJ-associated protein